MHHSDHIFYHFTILWLNSCFFIGFNSSVSMLPTNFNFDAIFSFSWEKSKILSSFEIFWVLQISKIKERWIFFVDSMLDNGLNDVVKKKNSLPSKLKKAFRLSIFFRKTNKKTTPKIEKLS